jgi:predicted aspartyl protease
MEGNLMGHIYVDSTIQGKDGAKKVRMFIDTGSTFTLLPQALADDLDIMLLPGRKQVIELADGSRKEYPVAIGDIEILDRKSIGERFLIAEVSEAVLGVLTLEALGLMVDPTMGKVKPSRVWQARGPWEARPIA